MADSALEAIETSTAAAVALVTGVTSVKVVPATDVFRENEDGSVVMDPVALPDSYPGALVSINDDEIEVIRGDAETRQVFGTSVIMYQVAIYVGVYAISDGTTEGGARRLAWQIGDRIIKSLTIMSPTGFPAGEQGFGPLKPGMVRPIIIDASTHGLLMQFFARFQITSS